MAEKNGTIKHCRAARFAKRPASSISSCPFKGPEIAIVPVRYALDRSRHDPAPDCLKSLPASGKWSPLPELTSRRYTLRQLYDGYLYVFDESASTFHEYAVNGANANFARIAWTQAHLGQDRRAGASADGKPYLLYPRGSRLHIGFSQIQWTWRLCEHMRSNPDARAGLMKPLDLARYSVTLSEPDTLPLREIAMAVADIDQGVAIEDGRFDDSSVPTSADSAGAIQNDTRCMPLSSAVGADAYWLGSVPDKDSALLIALDDPLAILKDLGLQLAADQAAYRVWHKDHEHKVQIARTVTNLCASSDNPELLPASVRHDVVLTQRYLREVDDCLEQLHLDEVQRHANVLGGDALVSLHSSRGEELRQAIADRYGVAPSMQEYEFWKQREKWRREIDRDGARAYIAAHQPTADRLIKQIRDSQADFREWAEHIGLDPAVLSVDTAHPDGLLYLKTVMSDLLTIFAQDQQAQDWLLQQEKRATTLFGTMRYGFSGEIKRALHQQANKLLDGINDHTNLATRVGELNSVLNHAGFAEMSWVKNLGAAAQATFAALLEMATASGKALMETILTAWLPVDTRMSQGGGKDLAALLRSLMIGQLLLGSVERIAVNARVATEIKSWWREKRLLDSQMDVLRRNWTYPRAKRERASLSRQISELEKRIHAHELKIPLLLDFQDGQHALMLQNKMHAHLQSGHNSIDAWKPKADDWLKRLGSAAATGVTWGVILLNLINTALVYETLTRDGEFSPRDMIKVGYGLSYSFSLLAAVYIAAPWAVISAAQPVQIGGKTVGILDRSASFWEARGNSAWGSALRALKGSLLVAGTLNLLAGTLEITDLIIDLKRAKTSTEQSLVIVKILAVLTMTGGGFSQTLLGAVTSKAIASVVFNPWFAIGLFLAGLVYAVATMALNYIKQDSVGWWLRRCCWSRSPEHQYSHSARGHSREINDFFKINLSPIIFVRQTFHLREDWTHTNRSTTKKAQNGAWIQLLIPQPLRNQQIEITVSSSERPWGILPATQTGALIHHEFLENGLFTAPSKFGSATNQRPPTETNSLCFPSLPASGTDILWETWVPLTPEAYYIELQIKYPSSAFLDDTDSTYLYQIAIEESGETLSDGLILTSLTKSSSHSPIAIILPIL